jgi:hypothetical protein
MKLKSILLAAIAAAGLGQVASAQTTVIDITGATAFRGAAVEAILDSFTSVDYGYTGAVFTAANAHIYKGTVQGIAGTTIVRTAWNGSTEGARTVAYDLTLNAYLPTTATVSATGTANLTGNNQPGSPEIYFTDCDFTSTVYDSLGKADQIGTATEIGSIVFTMLKNEMALGNPKIASYNAFTNVSEQQFRALWSPNNAGRTLLSHFTGDPADDDTRVYATGRNDYSGTRTIYLLETGYGASNLVSQWKINSTSNNVTSIQLWPVNDNTPGNDNRSLQWVLGDPLIGQDPNNEVAGNGGYFSGSVLRGLMDDTSNNVQVLDEVGGIIANNQNLILVTSISIGDAAQAIVDGAKALNYNGYGVTPGTLSTADKEKIQNGQYTLWSFQQLVHSDDADANEINVYGKIIANIPGNIGALGLTMTEMAGVSRDNDGAVVFVVLP